MKGEDYALFNLVQQGAQNVNYLLLTGDEHLIGLRFAN
jgi:hypothetical protein